jgi:probable rRNA maturation factor
LPRVKENASEFKQKVEVELHRVMIHGLLHLLGYKDSSRQEKIEMREKENCCLDLLQTRSDSFLRV